MPTLRVGGCRHKTGCTGGSDGPGRSFNQNTVSAYIAIEFAIRSASSSRFHQIAESSHYILSKWRFSPNDYSLNRIVLFSKVYLPPPFLLFSSSSPSVSAAGRWPPLTPPSRGCNRTEPKPPTDVSRLGGFRLRVFVDPRLRRDEALPRSRRAHRADHRPGAAGGIAQRGRAGLQPVGWRQCWHQVRRCGSGQEGWRAVPVPGGREQAHGHHHQLALLQEGDLPPRADLQRQ